MIDIFGPFKCFTQKFERNMRQNAGEYKIYIMVFICVATGALNIQAIEGTDTDHVMSAFNRFFCEATVPKIVFPDQQSSFMKALNEMEGQVYDLQYRLSEERGLTFKTCSPLSGHSSHGKVERVIRSLRESIEIAEVKNYQLTITDWQTICKGMEASYNSLPIGCYYSREDHNISRNEDPYAEYADGKSGCKSSCWTI